MSYIVLDMKDKLLEIKSLMKSIRIRLTNIEKKTSIHCGHEELVREAEEARFELEDFIESAPRKLGGVQ
jgi:hypothetical protein